MRVKTPLACLPTPLRSTKRQISNSRKTPASLASHAHTPSPNFTPPQPPNFSPEFTYGAYQATGTAPVTRTRYPKFQSLESERAFRKLHHAVALRWLGFQGYNNEGAGGHVTVRDPILTDHFWINPHGKSFSWMRPEDLVLMGPSKYHVRYRRAICVEIAVAVLVAGAITDMSVDRGRYCGWTRRKHACECSSKPVLAGQSFLCAVGDVEIFM
jgi:hypothetical protein